MEYYKLPGFENVYLEDSYVLGFEEEQDLIRILLDLVLTEDHPQYHIPLQGEQYCYKRAYITFNHVKSAIWVNKALRKYRDVNEETDYGNIDRLLFSNDHYYLEGDWGKLDIISSPAVVTILNGSY
jgi:hypothetical protein